MLTSTSPLSGEQHCEGSMPAIFPAPGHDHARCSAHAITHAEAVCAERGERLTGSRRQVLEAAGVEP
jgi:hypothetical protein